MVKAIVREAELRSRYADGEPVRTIYFGGGTPSVLEPKELEAIFNALHKSYTIENGTEITLEANPDDLGKDKLKELRECGINRLSIGLQSFIEEELKWMNRSHSVEQNVACIAAAQDAGFGNITADLIYGSKFQTEQTWTDALKKIETLGIQHLSCYNLTAEERTVFGVNVAKHNESEVDDELSARQFELLMQWSVSAGFEQYEISNFSKEGFVSKHNSAYWLGEKYIGLGPSAHSYDLVSRQWNISNNSQYIARIMNGVQFFEREELSEKTRLNEYVLTRLRTKWGLKISEMRNAFPNYRAEINESLSAVLASGNLICNGDVYVLTANGKKLADRIASDLMIT